MKYLLYLFFASLPLGQLGAVATAGGKSVYLHDIVLLFLLPYAVFRFGIPLLTRQILGFIITAAVSLLVASTRLSPADVFSGALYFLRFVLYASVYFLAASSGMHGIWLLEQLFMAGCIFAALGFFQYVFYPSLRDLVIMGWDPHYYRFVSTFLDPNFSGLYIVLTFFLSFIVLEKYPKIRLGTQSLLIVALYLTYSRSSYLAVLAGMVLYAWNIGSKRIIAGAVLFLLLILAVPGGKLDVTRVFRYESSAARLSNWSQSLDLIMKSPVFGHGFNTLGSIRYLRGTQPDYGLPVRVGGGMDNSFLFVLATTGIIGLAAFVWMMIGMYKISATAGWKSAMVAIAVHSLFNNSLFYPWIFIWMMVFAGAAEKSGMVRHDTD